MQIIKLADDIFVEGASIGTIKYKKYFCYLNSSAYVKIYYENEPEINEVMIDSTKIIDGEKEIIIQEPYYKLSNLYMSRLLNIYPIVDVDGDGEGVDTDEYLIEVNIKEYNNGIIYVRKGKVQAFEPKPELRYIS
jgi:hypothetical protein